MKLLRHCNPVYKKRVDQAIQLVYVAPDCDVCRVDLAHISADPVKFRLFAGVHSCPVTDTRECGWLTGEGTGELQGGELINPTILSRPFVGIMATNDT